ncbi:MAG: cupin domain-containing protein [Caldilineaceae bacterium]|nr:cupin domain-containing protein [Caldilineaceae bacterium]
MKTILSSLFVLCLLLAACVPIPLPVAAPVAAPATTGEVAAAPAPMADLTGEFELVQLIVDFPAGTWTPAHTHGGMLLVTVLSGEQTVRDEQGVEKVYKAGESFVERPGEYLEIGNAGQDLVTVSAAALLPKGANLSTTKEGINTDNAPPGPTTVYKTNLMVTEPLGEFELVQLIVDFPSGTWTPAHTHGGELLVTVLNGEQTVRDEQGGEKVYKAGESFTEYPGEYLEIGNAGQDLVTVSALALLPKGATLSTTKEGISTDNAPPGPTTLYQARLSATSK